MRLVPSLRNSTASEEPLGDLVLETELVEDDRLVVALPNFATACPNRSECFYAMHIHNGDSHCASNTCVAGSFSCPAVPGDKRCFEGMTALKSNPAAAASKIVHHAVRFAEP